MRSCEYKAVYDLYQPEELPAQSGLKSLGKHLLLQGKPAKCAVSGSPQLSCYDP